MKKKILFLLFFILTGTLMMNCQPDTSEYVRHVVVFKYKPEATEAQIKEITDAFRDLKSKIPGIVDFETGVNNSPENLNQDFTHVYLLTFENAEARDNYLPHPEHKEFGKILRSSGIFDGVFVVDYQIEE
ncbi:MAG: Dabb family protein [Cyclobacteriaceae bacterium]